MIYLGVGFLGIEVTNTSPYVDEVSSPIALAGVFRKFRRRSKNG